MTKFKALIFRNYCLATILAVIGFGYLLILNHRLTTPNSDWDPAKIHQVKFFEQELFLQGLAELEKKPPVTPTPLVISSPDEIGKGSNIKGGIVPHHLLASGLLSRFFSLAGQQSPSVIVVIGPNHQELGEALVLTSQYAWLTPSGLVEPATAVITKLDEHILIKVDEAVLPTDQSISGMMPYIKHFSPNSKVVPLLVSNKAIKSQINDLADFLAYQLPKDAIIIAAVDFSHYLNSAQAEQKDQETLSIIKNRDDDKLLKLSNDHLDGPASIALLLMTMDKLGVKDLQVLENTNSGRLLNFPETATTSYFSIILNN